MLEWLKLESYQYVWDVLWVTAFSILYSKLFQDYLHKLHIQKIDLEFNGYITNISRIDIIIIVFSSE